VGSAWSAVSGPRRLGRHKLGDVYARWDFGPGSCRAPVALPGALPALPTCCCQSPAGERRYHVAAGSRVDISRRTRAGPPKRGAGAVIAGRADGARVGAGRSIPPGWHRPPGMARRGLASMPPTRPRAWAPLGSSARFSCNVAHRNPRPMPSIPVCEFVRDTDVGPAEVLRSSLGPERRTIHGPGPDPSAPYTSPVVPAQPPRPRNGTPRPNPRKPRPHHQADGPHHGCGPQPQPPQAIRCRVPSSSRKP